ncbi:MAG: sensor histidine kinase [Myxococcaceae bacterium]
MSLRLRSRLTLAFVALALLPLAAVVPFALNALTRTLAAQQTASVEAAFTAARAEWDGQCPLIRRAMADLAQSVVVEQWARDLARGTPEGSLRDLARQLMDARGLTVLSLMDERGTTLSSGHLPARMGDPDPTLLGVTHVGRGTCVVAQLDVGTASGIQQVPAIVSAQTYSYGTLQLRLVGGLRLDRGLPEQLARLTAAHVTLWHDGRAISAAGGVDQPGLHRTLPAGERLEWRFTFDGSTPQLARRGLLGAFALLAGLGLSLSLLIGAWVSRRITRPIEALRSASQDVALGHLNAHIQNGGPGEVGELVTAFNGMTQRLRAATEERIAAERVAAWQDIAKALAHEIKNPLTPIQMSLETLAAAVRANNPKALQLLVEATPAMLEEVARLRRTVDAFSRFARLPQPLLQRFDLGQWSASVLTLHGATRPGTTLTTELASRLWVHGDRDQLSQLLVNLVKNAQEALPPEGGHVTVRTRRSGAWAVLEIEDTGPGVPPEVQSKLFTPYFTTKAGGSGLGLAIASRIAHEHGGKLELDLHKTPGSIFRLLLPLAEEPTAPAESTSR